MVVSYYLKGVEGREIINLGKFLLSNNTFPFV